MLLSARGWLFAGLAAFVLLVALLHLWVGGSVAISPDVVFSQLFTGPGGQDSTNLIIWQIRLPRLITALAAGGLLGAVGAAFQALFRNPLAEPYIIGVSSGAALGGTLAILAGLSGMLAGLALPLFGFVGGMGALGLVLLLARVSGGRRVETLLLAGVVMGSLLSALVSIVLILAGEDTNAILRWLLGSVTPAEWSRGGILWGVLALSGPLLWLQSRKLNAIAISEEAAGISGVEVKKVQAVVLTVGTAGASAAVGTCGVIPFLGLVAPHLVRKLVGDDLRVVLPGSVLAGGGLLILADLAAQQIKRGAELPVGAVTALLGAPILLWLLSRRS